MAYHITFPPQSNRASWVFVGQITDMDDNPIDLTGCSLLFHVSCDPYWPYPGLTASTANGKLTIVDLGTFRWFFTLGDMQGLQPVQYQTGLTITNDDDTQTMQLSTGPLVIYDGVVPAR
jgi:hypothetical protein